MNSVENLQQLFSSQKDNISFGRGLGEVNGLHRGTIPENCDVIDQFECSRSKERRDFYLVEVNGATLLMRICAAATGSGYDEFAVIHEHSANSEEKEKIKTIFYQWKESLSNTTPFV